MRAIPLLLASAFVFAMARSEPVPPRIVAQPQPGSLTNSDGEPVEGWAIVRYSVRSDGSPANIRVIAMAPPQADESRAIAAVEQWQFKPATDDGTAIAWHNNESVVEFRDVRSAREASDRFQAAYTEIFEHLKALELPEIGELPDQALADSIVESLEEIRAANVRLLNEVAATTGELGLALSQAMFIDMSLRDQHRAYEAVRLATDPRIDALAPKDLFAALVMRLELEIRLGRIHDALLTHTRLAAGYGADETDPAAAAAAALEDRWTNEEILNVSGFIGERPWRLDAARRIFTIGNIQGELTTISADCDTRRLSLEFQANVEWQLPASLGECTLFVDGAPETHFTFYEMLPAAE